MNSTFIFCKLSDSPSFSDHCLRCCRRLDSKFNQGKSQGSKCPSLPGFTHWVNPGKPGLGFKPYFGKSGEYWEIKCFKCSDVQNCANWWILGQVR